MKEPLITFDIAGQKLAMSIEDARALYERLKPLFARPQPVPVVPWSNPLGDSWKQPTTTYDLSPIGHP